MSIQQREIKFRAYDKKEKQWLLGYEMPNLGGFSLFGETVMLGEWSAILDQYIFERNGHKQEDLVIMQFTGLLDKNGKEIYEGDILRLIESPLTWNDTKADYVALNYIGVIEWDNEGADYNITGKEELRGLGNGKQETEIIGNIYENLDLLTEKK